MTFTFSTGVNVTGTITTATSEGGSFAISTETVVTEGSDGGIDTFVFEPTATANGADTINNSVAANGASDDLLDFTAFLGAAATSAGPADFVAAGPQLEFRVNNERGGFVSPTGTSTSFGHRALMANTGSNNTGVGKNALMTNTSGTANTSLGTFALEGNTTGAGNSAVGSNALLENTGASNTAIGSSALRNNQTRTNNTALGDNALFSNDNGLPPLAGELDPPTGFFNTATGSKSLRANTSGYMNTASGWQALTGNTTGYINTALGASALKASTTGDENTAVGVDALSLNTTGNANTAVGSGAGTDAANRSNTTALGAAVTCTGEQPGPHRQLRGHQHRRLRRLANAGQRWPLQAERKTISEGFDKRYNAENFKQAIKQIETAKGKQLTYTAMPENKPDNSSVQLGLFDTGSSNTINRAAAYINPADVTVIDKKTARVLNIIRTKDKPEHELIVLMTAKSTAFKQYVYKLYSNAEELQFSANWMNSALLQHELTGITNNLKKYDQQFYNDGKAVFHISIGDDDKLETLNNFNPHHKEGTLVVHNSRVGFVSYLASEDGKAVFMPSLHDKKDLGFYQQYTAVRDMYFELFEKETTGQTELNDLRKELNEAYESLIKGLWLTELIHQPAAYFKRRSLWGNYTFISRKERRRTKSRSTPSIFSTEAGSIYNRHPIGSVGKKPER